MEAMTSAAPTIHRPLWRRVMVSAILLAGLISGPGLPGQARERADRGNTGDQLLRLLDTVPAKSGFAFSELTPEGPRLIHGEREDDLFAVGSSFKLFILGRLAEALNRGKAHLDDTMNLSADFTGPPQSELAEWPIGSPVTLHTLALKMISISDNTATDHLLHHLGRRNVEGQMVAMGHGTPQRNRPLLSTREMVMLRDLNVPSRRRRWAELDEAGRRAFLSGEISALHDFEAIEFDTTGYTWAEWFASPMDMARALDWLRTHTEESDNAHPLRAVLSLRTQIPFDEEIWPYTGFKGGSEDQVLAGNWLLRHRSGRWFALTVAFNKPDGAIDQEAVAAVLKQMTEVIEASLESALGR